VGYAKGYGMIFHFSMYYKMPVKSQASASFEGESFGSLTLGYKCVYAESSSCTQWDKCTQRKSKINGAILSVQAPYTWFSDCFGFKRFNNWLKKLLS
jgi:hypothetical protein